jgi:hypothetical protein
MAQTSEAACLLQSGSMYSRRLGLRSSAGAEAFAGIKPGGVSVYFGDAPIDHLDFEGWWQRAFVDGVHYLKGLDGTVRAIDRERAASGMVLRRRTLAFAEAADLDDSVRSMALGLIDDLGSGRLEIVPPPSNVRRFEPESFRSFLELVGGRDSASWFARRERYLATYGPLPTLPPDCPNAATLQATLGHATGRAFGGSRPSEFYVRSEGEFVEHALAVRGLLEGRLAQCRGVFLAGPDALRRPVDEVLAWLRAVGSTFPIGDRVEKARFLGQELDEVEIRLGAVHAFLDDFGPPLPDSEGWRALRASGLGKVTLGVESAEPEVRAKFGRSRDHGDLRTVVENLKAAEVGVGILNLVGAGGRGRIEAEIEATAGLIGSIGLGRGDLVSLVDARHFDETATIDDPLTDDDVAGVVAALKRRSAEGRGSNGPKLVAYNPDKQWA